MKALFLLKKDKRFEKSFMIAIRGQQYWNFVRIVLEKSVQNGIFFSKRL